MTASKVQRQWSFLLVEWLCIQQQQPVIRNIHSSQRSQQQDVSVCERGVAQPAKSLRHYILQVRAPLFISWDPLSLMKALPGPTSLLSLSASNYPFYWVRGILFARTTLFTFDPIQAIRLKYIIDTPLFWSSVFCGCNQIWPKRILELDIISPFLLVASHLCSWPC